MVQHFTWEHFKAELHSFDWAVYSETNISLKPLFEKQWPETRRQSTSIDFNAHDFAVKDVTHQSPVVTTLCSLQRTNNYPHWFITFVFPWSPLCSLSPTHTHQLDTCSALWENPPSAGPWVTNNHFLPCCSQLCSIYRTYICNAITAEGSDCVHRCEGLSWVQLCSARLRAATNVSPSD